jgi:hypothetical protein
MERRLLKLLLANEQSAATAKAKKAAKNQDLDMLLDADM